jgi:hypothetical protein
MLQLLRGIEDRRQERPLEVVEIAPVKMIDTRVVIIRISIRVAVVRFRVVVEIRECTKLHGRLDVRVVCIMAGVRLDG